MPSKTASYTVEVRLSGTWTALDASAVVSVEGLTESTADRGAPLASGDDSEATCDVTILRTALSSIPLEMPIRVTYTVDSDTRRTFVGTVERPQRSLIGSVWRMRCVGIAARLRRARLYSPLFVRQPIARQTTLGSVTSATNAAVSPLEWALLSCGGWPVSRDYENPGALFYYALDQALIAPDDVWFAGENTWEELLKLLAACGGQLWQDELGIVRYTQPLSLGGTNPSHTFADSGTPTASLTVYGNVEEVVDHAASFTKVTCTYTGRRVLPLQQVLEDTEARLIGGGETITVALDTSHPLYTIESASGLIALTPGNALTTTLKSTAILALFADGSAANQGASGYTHSVSLSAQRFVLTITNATTRPIIIYRIALTGQPVGPGPRATITVGSGDTTKAIADSPYIQRASHATQIATLQLALVGGARALYTLSDCPYDPNRAVGETIALTCGAWGISNLRCRIVGIRHTNTGLRASYDVVPVADLSTFESYILVGTADYGGTARRLGT